MVVKKNHSAREGSAPPTFGAMALRWQYASQTSSAVNNMAAKITR